MARNHGDAPQSPDSGDGFSGPGAPFARGWMTARDAPTTVVDERSGGVDDDPVEVGRRTAAAARAAIGPVTYDAVSTSPAVDGPRPLRVETVAPKRSWIRAFGAWLGKSLVALVLVASLVAAAAAATSLYHTRQDLRDARRDGDTARAAITKANQRAEASASKVSKAVEARDSALAKNTDLARTNKELGIEVKGLRALLADDDTAAAASTADAAPTHRSAHTSSTASSSRAATAGASAVPDDTVVPVTPPPVVDDQAAVAAPGE